MPLGPMSEAEIRGVLEDRGAVLKGHFRLSSGRHSEIFVQKFRVFEDPRLTQRFGEAVAGLWPGEFDAVASPALGAIVLGFATALAAERRFVMAERVGEALAFRRGFELGPRERVLVVEDVVTTAGSAAEVVELVRAQSATPVGVGALIDRKDEARAALGVPLKALAVISAPSWEPADCPLCSTGAPLTDPGSRRCGGERPLL
ncbi:orotate phosphoribosyltransferase [soil metagenome]